MSDTRAKRDDEAGRNPELMQIWKDYEGSLTYHSLTRAYAAGRNAENLVCEKEAAKWRNIDEGVALGIADAIARRRAP